MNNKLLFLILVGGLFSCSSPKKRRDFPCVPLDSMIVDYYAGQAFNASDMKDGYLPYPLLGITGYTLQEVVNKYGVPDIDAISVWKDLDLSGEHDFYPFQILSVILQKFPNPITIYDYTWRTFKNPDLYMNVFFIDYCGELRVVFGQRLNSKIHIME